MLTLWQNTSTPTRKEVLCCCDVLVPSVMSHALWPHGLQPARLFCPWGFSRQEYWKSVACPSPGDLPNPGIIPRSPPLQVDSLPAESPGKPKNTGVGSLSLLQGDFLIQELNQVPSMAGRLFTDCVDLNKLWEIPQEMRRPDYLTCLLQPVCRSRSNS